eukprot:2435336-Pleurochrysis_carterae.AAC.1
MNGGVAPAAARAPDLAYSAAQNDTRSDVRTIQNNRFAGTPPRLALQKNPLPAVRTLATVRLAPSQG